MATIASPNSPGGHMAHASGRLIVKASLAGLLIFACAQPAGAWVTLGAETRLTETGAQQPRAIATADVVDGSPSCPGCLDLIVANQLGDSVSILAGDGAGNFASIGPNISVGNAPMAVAVGDCDGDGDTDIFVMNNAASTITVLTNQRAQGNPNVFTSSTVSLTLKPDHMISKDNTGAPLDVDGDGKLDLALASHNTDKLLTLHGNGNCTFTTKQDTIIGGNGPSIVVAGNFDGVNGVDLAAVDITTPKTMTILQNDGTGNFPTCTSNCSSCSGSLCTQFQAGSDPTFAVAGDFDGDTDLDLAITDADNGDGSGAGVTEFFNLGSMVFSAGSPFSTGGRSPEAAVGGQFGGDSNEDLVVVNKGSSTISFLRGLGSGGFDRPYSPVSLGTSTGTEDITAGDFNGDGAIDVATANKGSSNISICMNSASTPGQFTCHSTTAQQSGFGNGPRGVAIMDVGNTDSAAPDGFNDVVMVNENSDNVTILLNNGAGGLTSLFHPPAALPSPAITPRDVIPIGAADFAIAACGATGTTKDKLVIVQDRNVAGGTTLGANDCPTALAFADMNNDSIPDLIVLNQNSNDLSFFKGLGNNSYQLQGNPVCVALNGSACLNLKPTDLAVGDFGTSNTDGTLDGKLDIAVSNKGTTSVPGVVYILFSDGSFGVSSRKGLTTAPNSQPQSIAVADFDQDGKNDVAVVVHNTGSSTVTTARGVEVFIGTGAGSFGPEKDFDAGKTPFAIVATNFSQDTGNRIDLVVTSEGQDKVNVFEGRGNGGASGVLFEAAVSTGVGLNPEAVDVGTIDAGSMPDIVTANNASDDASLVLNTSPVCGDGVKTAPETCDPPGTSCPLGCGTGTCSPTCRCQ